MATATAARTRARVDPADGSPARLLRTEKELERWVDERRGQSSRKAFTSNIYSRIMEILGRLPSNRRAQLYDVRENVRIHIRHLAIQVAVITTEEWDRPSNSCRLI
ncbi:hypothetical protein BSKO_08766 [Bryopsis sp. KO-2023]|nr:hypothetical protein BSKO_08766 [Bryopsis sp. KO-2023]